MAQRYDIVKIDFQANARGANAAIEALRQQAEKCNDRVVALKEELKTAINANMPADQIEALRSKLNGAQKDARQFSNAYKELVKGMRTLDQGIKAFNDGTLDQMNQAFQKAVYNAAKLTRTKLDPMSDSYKKDYRELTSLMDASQQNYARLQGDAQQMLKTLRDGGKVSRQALTEELNAQKELLQVLAETDKGYQRTKMNVDQLSHYLQRMGGDYDYIRQNITDTQKVSDEMLRTMYRELEQTNNEGKVTKKMLQENAKAMREIRAEQERRVQNVLGGDLSKQSEGNIRTAIANAKELMSVYGSTSKQAQTLAAQIVNAEEHLKQHGIEGERAARKEAEAVQLLADKHKMMQDRVNNLGNLSASALAETQKYWEAQRDGAERTSTAYKKAEKNLKAINAEMQRQATAQLQTDASKLGRKNLGTLSEQELQTSIAAAKQLAASMKSTDPAYKQLVDNIVRAEQHIKQFGLEGQRSTRQAAEQLQTMTDRMAKLKTLSAASLEETRRFWQAQMDGATRGSQAYKTAEQNMKQVVAEQERLTAEQNKAAANQLLKRGNLSTMSEGEIRRAIEAAKQYQQTLSTSDAAHQRLSKAIVNAEEHIKKYGIEAERSARKEAAAAAEAAKKRKETDKMMSDQLKQGTALSESALRAQQQYWQRLIDDPKTAATSLRHYQAQLERTKKLQEQMAANRIKTEGQSALAFFRGDTSNASATQIQEQAKALKAYRDSLPQKTNAKLIEEIDALLLKAGQSAKKAAQDTMPLRDAYRIAMQSLQGSFKGTTEQLKQAKKALEEQLLLADKGSKRYNQLQRALNGIALEEKRVGELSREVQAVLDQPKGRSYNALKQAVEQGRAALQNMDRTTKEGQQAFDELAKKVKAADQEMKQLAATSKGTSTAFEKAWSRVKTYVGVYVGTAVAMQKVTATMGDLMDLSDRMGEVRKTTGFTADEVGRLSENLKKMDVRTSLTSLMEISASAGQLGLKTLEDVQGFTEAANKLMIALPEMGREAATEMMRVAIATGEVDKIRKQLQEGTVEGSSATAVAMEKIASTIDRLRATSASTAPEITDFVKRVGAVGAQSGITIDQVAALGSTVSSLGMRIEMSATALSRMIPAIRNNAFELAKAIGVTPDTIRNLFDTGRGMEVILMILQRIKDTGMDADSVEQMLGMAGMRDIMKDLNQQGARAGIVFSGLSQNVDELRRQLGVASEAYEENIAIQQEFDKMNETTAAKWERLKNAFEEMFVGDEAQRGLGVLIDMLRGAVDIINDLQGYIVRIGIAFAAWKAGVGGAIWTYLINPIRLALTGVHSLDFQVKGLAATWRTAWKSMDAATKTNWIFAIISAVVMLGKHIYDTATRISELQQELNRLDNETDDAVRHVGRLVTSFNEASVKANAANKKEAELREQTEKLSKEVDKLKKSTDDGTASTDELKKKQAELEEKEKQLKKATDESNKANKERSNLISEMNSKYSTYLGYMLNEKTAAEQVASAHQLIIAALKEERKQKGLNALHDAVDKEYAEDIKEYSEDSQSNLKDIPRGAQRRILDQWRRVLTAATIDADKGEFRLSGVNGVTKGGTYRSEEELKKAMRSALREIIKTEAADVSGNVKVSTWAGKGIKSVDTFLNDIWGNSIDDGFGDWAETYISRERDIAQATHDNQVEVNQAHQETVQAAVADINSNMEALRKTSAKNNKFTDDQIRSMAQNVNALVAGYERHSEDMTDSERNRIFGKGNETTLQNAVNNVLANLDQNTRARVFRVAQRGKKTGTGYVDTNITNPWGTSERADSTTYTEMTAEQLVNRREQMNKFVNSLQTDTDVKAVLNEDKALKKAIEAGMSSDMRTVIEWYNTERLKIQDELHARHLTNTGDWLDPKKERMRKKQLQDEWNMYLREIDAYYTERKTRIEEAGTDEGLTEAEIRNRTLANEMEWRQRRAELQKLYADKNVEVTAEEQQAIFDIISERTGDDVKYVKAQIASTVKFMKDIGKMSEKELKEALSKLGLGWERDFLKQQQAVTQQMKAIQDIIDKERPFNGITKQLRESLATMDILTGDMRERYKELLKTGTDEEKKRFNEEQNREEMRRTSFLLGEAEQAYSTTIDRVMQQMREKGMTAWADWLSIRPEQQEALMAQLRQTYDAIQDAIKKEASQLKKQAEIMWNNILVPGGDGKTTLKQMLDRTVAQLGIDQGRVSRANSLIGAGASSERVADKLAIQQMRLQLTMQEHYYNLMKKQGRAHVDMLNQQADVAERRGNAEEATRKRLDAQHAEMALNLATAKEETELAKQREEIIARTEESQNRLYTELRSWADLLSSSLQGVFEASHAGDAEYYNERAKLDLTGKGGPGAGTYVVIDDAGTSDATAHYEYLDERQALERQHEIEIQNAQAEAWRKLMDDLNMKMSEQITDWMNAALQNQSIDANTQAVIANTQALWAQVGQTGGQQAPVIDGYRRNADGFAMDEQGQTIAPVQPVEMPAAEGETPAWKPVWQMTDEERAANQEGIISMWQTYTQAGNEAMAQMSEAIGALPNPVPDPVSLTPETAEAVGENAAAVYNAAADAKIAASDRETQVVVSNSEKQKKAQTDANNQTTKNTQSSFAKMATAANMYGIAYQTMSNDNLSTAQKFQMFALQAAGQAAISMLTMDLAAGEAKNTVQMPGILGKLLGEMPYPAAIATFAGITALMGGLMALAMSSVTKSKSQIAQASGASVGAGRLATGMLTYAEGNVNELTDPASLTPGRQYNVDGADGKTYRARYMGKGAKTHITNGAEFHLVGEAGREAIIDAKTTRLLQMNETGIWRDIQTLYNGGSISGLRTRRRRGGVAAFADGNVGEFEDIGGDNIAANGTGGGMSIEMLASLQASIDRQSDLLENALVNGIKAVNKWTGSDGIPAMYNKMQKEAQRHGEKYL